MGGQRPHAQRPGLAEQLGGGDHGAPGVDHVVDDHRVQAGHVADHLQGRRLIAHIGPAALVDEGDPGVQVAGEAGGQAHPAGVGGDDHHGIAHRLLQVLVEDGQGGQVVEGLHGVPLDLGAVQVHGHDAVGSGRHQQVGHQPGGDRLPSEVLLVLAGVAVEGHHGGDPFGRSPVQGVEHDQLFHDVEVDRLAVALQYEAVGPAHTLVETDIDLPIGKTGALHPAQMNAQQPRHLFGQGRVGRPREEHHPLAAGQFHRCSPFLLRLTGLLRSVAGHLPLLRTLHPQGARGHVAGDG